MMQNNKSNRTDPQDSEWINETLAGNTRSFDNIVLKYQRQIYNLILKAIRNGVDAQDLTQNVFINAFSKLKKFRKESSLSTWLYSIAVNQMRNYWRKQKYKLDYAESDINSSVKKDLFELFKYDIDREISSEETKQIVDNLISFLPPQQREIFVLYYLIGHSCEEISKILNKSPSNIKIQLFRGRKQLFSKFKNISE
jgi:RNA polymerase sigma-70 factor (ECF subfamily)